MASTYTVGALVAVFGASAVAEGDAGGSTREQPASIVDISPRIRAQMTMRRIFTIKSSGYLNLSYYNILSTKDWRVDVIGVFSLGGLSPYSRERENDAPPSD